MLIAVILSLTLPNEIHERWKREAEQDRKAEGVVASPGEQRPEDRTVPATSFPVPDGLSVPV